MMNFLCFFRETTRSLSVSGTMALHPPIGVHFTLGGLRTTRITFWDLARTLDHFFLSSLSPQFFLA